MAVFAVDFEATKENEIISIGVVNNKFHNFGAYVKPNYSVICEFIEDLTGISQEEIDFYGTSTEKAFSDLYNWTKRIEPDFTKWEFICYGSHDIDFVKTAIPYCYSEEALFMAMYLYHQLNDVSKFIQKFFGSSVSLMTAYNSIGATYQIQKHDALEDAAMLLYVNTFVTLEGVLPEKIIKVKKNGKVKETPRQEHDETLYKYGVSYVNTVWPEGTFYAKAKSGTREFKSIHAAIDFLLEKTPEQERSRSNRNKVMIKIMKSIRTGCKYANFQWYRIKQPKQALNIEDI